MTTVNALSSKEAKLQALLKGLQTVLPQGSSLPVAGQQYTQAQLVAKVGTYVSLYAAKGTAQSQAKAAVAALHAGVLQMDQFASALITVLKQQFGAGNPLLAGFGIPPPKERLAQTAAGKAVAVAKRAATRKARGVMSAKQRATIPAAPTPEQVTIGKDGKATIVAPVVPAATSTVSNAVPATIPIVPKS